MGNQCVPRLIAKIRFRYTQTQDVIKTLGEIRDPRAVEPLVGYLNRWLRSPPRSHCRATIDALANIGDRRAVDALLRVLGLEPSRDVVKRGGLGSEKAQILSLKGSAIRALEQLGDRRAVEGIVSCLWKTELRDEAESALDKIDANWKEYGAGAAYVKLVELKRRRQAEAKEEQRRQAEEEERRRFSSRSTEDMANTLLRGESPEERLQAISDLDKRGGPQALPPLLDALVGFDYPTGRDYWPTLATVDALGNRGDPEAVKPLMHLFRRCFGDHSLNADFRLHECITRALTKIGGCGVHKLVDALRDVNIAGFAYGVIKTILTSGPSTLPDCDLEMIVNLRDIRHRVVLWDTSDRDLDGIASDTIESIDASEVRRIASEERERRQDGEQ